MIKNSGVFYGICTVMNSNYDTSALISFRVMAGNSPIKDLPRLMKNLEIKNVTSSVEHSRTNG